jgi:predicted nucleotidyltransferase
MARWSEVRYTSGVPNLVGLTTREQQALDAFKTTLRALFGDDLLSLRLFGSRARGEGSEESDLDVLVVVRKRDRAICRRIVEAALEIDLTHDTNLAPTVLSADEIEASRQCRTPFYGNVEKESIAL